MRAALLALALSLALPAAAQDLDLDLDAPAPAAAPKKKKGRQPPKPAADELSLDLDAPAPAPAPKKPAAGADLDLDLDAPAPAPAKPAAKPAAKGPTKGAPKKAELELDLDLDAPAAKPREAAGDDLELDLELDPVPGPKKPGTSPAKPQNPNVPAQQPAQGPAPTPTSQTPPAQSGEEEELLEDSFYQEEYHLLDLGLKVGGLLFSGRTDGVTAAPTGAMTAGRGLTVPVALEVRVHPTDALPGLGFAFEAGFFPKSGTVARGLAYDPDFAQTSSAWSILAVPLSVGLSYDVAIAEGISIGVRAAGLAQYVRSTGSWTTGGTTVESAPTSAVALGWLAGAEAAFRMGPGAVVVDARLAQAFTDLGLKDAYAQQGAQAEQPWNRAAPGNVQGFNVLVGYRLAL